MSAFFGSGAGTSARTQLVLALALMATLALFVMVQGEPTPPQPYDLNSPAADGLLALRVWLSELGYAVHTTSGSRFVLPPSTRLFFVYPTTYPYNAAEAEQLYQWVNSGNTLVLVGPGAFDAELQSRFGVAVGPQSELISEVTQPQPLLPDLSAPIALASQESTLDLSAATDALAVLVDPQGQPTAAVQSLGQGHVWHLSRHHDLSNALLRDPQQATLLPALLRALPPGSEIRFDTYHRNGAVDSVATAQNLQEWLYYTPSGWAMLWLLGVTAIYLLLQGWRLGPPLPATATLRRREAAEYVVAMANLLRRARRRDAVAQHHKVRLKRTLGRLHQISPDLDDETFLAQWQAHTPAGGQPDAAQIRHILQTLTQSNDEQQLVTAVQQIDQYTQRGQQ